LKESGIELLVGCAVKEISADVIHTSTGSLVRNNTIWTSGVKAPDFVSRDGFNKVGPQLQVVNMNSVFAIGDIVAGRHGPPTAQNAVQQGKFLASYFNSDFAAEHPPYKYNEFCKILHTNDSIYIEYDGTTFILPKMFGWILDKFTGI
jgi:NADH dehydrogenase FAD-containing subunit